MLLSPKKKIYRKRNITEITPIINVIRSSLFSLNNFHNFNDFCDFSDSGIFSEKSRNPIFFIKIESL